LQFYFFYHSQDEKGLSNAEIGKREKARLREMEKLKREKIQKILDAQNAAIDADMVCLLGGFVLP